MQFINLAGLLSPRHASRFHIAEGNFRGVSRDVAGFSHVVPKDWLKFEFRPILKGKGFLSSDRRDRLGSSNLDKRLSVCIQIQITCVNELGWEYRQTKI